MDFSSRRTQAIASSLAALVVVAPLAMRHLERDLNDTFASVTTELHSEGAAPRQQMLSPPPAPPPVQEREHAQRSDRALPDKLAKEKSAGEAMSSRMAAQQPHKLVRPEGQVSTGKMVLGADNAAPGVDHSYSGYDRLGRLAEAPAASVRVPADRDIRVEGLKKLEIQPGTVGPASTFDFKSDGTVTLTQPAARTATVSGLAANAPGTGKADLIAAPPIEENRDRFEAKEINPVKQVATEPVSTFSTDVDTASYAFVRRALNAGRLPPKDAVRVEEMINYFPYEYPAPESAETPFKPTVTVTQSPWNVSNKLVHVAVQGYELKSAERPRANLVFLMDVSGSMAPADRLPLVKTAFRMLLDELKPDDTVGIVTYASGSGILLEPTKASDKAKILAAIDQLGAGGSTAGAAGIADAYRLAETNFDKAAVNRVILATDGDFNVGITDRDELKGFIERQRQSGIFLSILGVGQGNLNDALMQTLAQNGNGTASYVDTLNEARKVLVDEASSTLFTIAKDVKVQIEWNPAAISEYRLIGYETRALRREDFNNDRVDAGDIGSGHTVTAIYEVTPVGALKLVDDLRYGKKVATAETAATATPAQDASAGSGELGYLKLRYKRPNEDTSQLIELPITEAQAEQGTDGKEVRFSIAVAAFGQLLKGQPYTQGYAFDDVISLAQGARGGDPFGYRAEFVNLVRLAKSARP